MYLYRAKEMGVDPVERQTTAAPGLMQMPQMQMGTPWIGNMTSMNPMMMNSAFLNPYAFHYPNPAMNGMPGMVMNPWMMSMSVPPFMPQLPSVTPSPTPSKSTTSATACDDEDEALDMKRSKFSSQVNFSYWSTFNRLFYNLNHHPLFKLIALH